MLREVSVVGQSLDRSLVTLGILAGGQATRLGGRDKAWLQRSGVPQVVRLARRFDGECAALLVSANANLGRYAEQGMSVVSDHVRGIGPIGGLDALAQACRTPWLLTLPVDIIGTNECLLRTLATAGDHGAVAEDDDGLQPLVALYRIDTLRDAISASLEAGEHAIQVMQARLALPHVCFSGLRFGNLNTPQDLLAAGVDDS